jgi:acetyltransferase
VKTRVLEELFEPKAIAVIGASNTRGSVGHVLFGNLVAADYGGVIYPVNRASHSVHGIQAFPAISRVPGKVDLAIIAVPAQSVPAIIEECATAGVGAVLIVSSGFKETGPAGKRLEDQVVRVARAARIRVLGPNCLGFMRPGIHLNASFAPVMPEPGQICFISQSGALGNAFLDWAAANAVGFSAFVSVGSMCDVDFGDLIDYFGADAHTKSIILHLESLPNARKFMRAARHFAKTKPIIVVKSGRTPRSALAAASHQGADTGDDTLYSAAFRRAGVVRVDAVEDLFAASEALSRVPSPRGTRLGIVTNAGGPAVMAVDRMQELGCDLADLSAETDDALRACLPSFAACSNPVDVGDDADVARFAAATEALLADDNCDGVLAILAPHATGCITETATALVTACRSHPNKPLLASLMGGTLVDGGLQKLHAAHIPAFHTPEHAVSAYMYMHQYTRSLANLYETPADILPQFEPDRDLVKNIFSEVARHGRAALTEIETKEVLRAYDIPVIDTIAATSSAECAEAARLIGLPVAVKILSPDVANKAAAGGIAFDVRSVGEAGRQYGKITRRVSEALPDAACLGVTVHGMSRRGVDVTVGSWRDGTFGPTLFVHARDGAARLREVAAVEFPPINQALARSLIDETGVLRLPQRKNEPGQVDAAAFERLLVKFSYLLVDFPEIVETELDPVQLRTQGVEVLDARMVIEPKDVRKLVRPGSHLIVSMYPSKYTRTMRVDGEDVEIRAIKPEDEPLWAEMVASLSQEAANYRFFGPVKQITKAMLVRYCHVDYDSEISLVAVKHSGEPLMLGVASFAVERPDDDQAEFAIVVRDDFQHRGLGTSLMNVLIDAARDMHVREIVGDVLSNNVPMLDFVESLGFEIQPSEDSRLRRVVLRT